jgi:NAD(P)-dependent dehydrogenase (short-subunit alcohol dehydrogenase family)
MVVTSWNTLLGWFLPLLDQVEYAMTWFISSFFTKVLMYPTSLPLNPNEDHDPQAILITGASTGIGFQAAKDLVDQGFIVLAGVRQDKDIQRIRSLGNSQFIPILLDVADEKSINRAFNQATHVLNTYHHSGNATKVPRLAGIINNAGIPENSGFECYTRSDTERVFAVNVHGAADVTRVFLPLLRASGKGGRVVLISSAAATMNFPFGGVYSASKTAVEGTGQNIP